MGSAPRTRPSRATDRARGRTGHVLGLRGRDHRLSPGPQELSEQLAALGVELRHDVIEQHQRQARAARGQEFPLGEEQREQCGPLLTLRAVGPQRRGSEQELELVAVRAVCSEAALEIGLPALGQLGGKALGVAGRRARAVAQLGLARQAQAGGELAEQRAQAVDRLGAILHQPDSVASQLRIPRVECGWTRRSGPHASHERIALRQRA